MKKTVLILSFVLLSVNLFSQQYDTEKLKLISTIWGETYLFHPSIIRADRNIEWEKQLVNFLPQIKKRMTDKEFVEIINSKLLDKLQDPFTLVQTYDKRFSDATENIQVNTNFDYLKITNEQLSDISSLITVYNAISQKKSKKPILIDLRISNELNIDKHTNTFFDYFASMLITTPIPQSLNIKREHYGWDEYNDWWFYEQKWKISNNDKQIPDNGTLKPFIEYSNELQQYMPEFDFQNFVSINRPIYFITNSTFLSYYSSLLIALQTNRNNTFFLNDKSGRIFTNANSNFISYKFKNYEFILNSGFYLNKGFTDLDFELNKSSINNEQIEKLKQLKQEKAKELKPFQFTITTKKYTSVNKTLSAEEKILGLIKIWTIVKYFYAYPNQCSIDWENSLGKYLELVQRTKSDKEYFTLIQEIMATLHDGHVSTYHASILDYSNIFVAPIKFEWIENKVIITAIDSSVTANIKVGDEITSIDGLLINKILENEKKKISSSNHQGLIATVINPGYFVGANGSIMKFGIHNKIIEVPRTVYIFQFMGFGDNRVESKIFNKDIGYLNLASLTDANVLEKELLKMKNTNGLIIDLRNSYPTADYSHFLQMLSTKELVARIDEVPVISANNQNKKQIEISKYTIVPDTSFTYNKPIMVLIDKTMISRPEDIAINLKAFPNVTFIGEQTQGTDGELTKINLPGGGETSFTGQIIKFGDGKKFQSIGIIPDIKVSRTIKGLKNDTDEILEKAIEELNKS